MVLEFKINLLKSWLYCGQTFKFLYNKIEQFFYKVKIKNL